MKKQTHSSQRKTNKKSLKQKALQKLHDHRKKKLFFMHKRLQFLKHPITLSLSAFVVLILMIPTLIVMPFSSTSTSNEAEEAGLLTEDTLEAFKEDDPALTVSVMRTESKQVENVSLETYVLRVVASEMPIDFEEEALKAQALAARTYIVNHLLIDDEDGRGKVTDTVEHQVYQDDEQLRKAWGTEYEAKLQKLQKAVAQTQGQIITHEKKPITPAFFSTSNGFTENSEDYWENELPYLRSVESPWDEKSPKFYDQQILTVDELNEKLDLQLKNVESVGLRVERTTSERVDTLKIGDQSFSGREIREKLALSSSDFTVEQKNDHFVFKTKGYGHGVGMSQYGANGMAQEGKDYEQIIHYYYKDVEIRGVEEAAPTLVSR